MNPAVADMKVIQARRELRDDLAARRRGDERGPVVCPVCDTSLRVYKRRYHSTMGKALAHFYNKNRTRPGRWVRVKCGELGGDYGKLIYWKHIERKLDVEAIYRITQKGINFAERFGLIRPVVYEFQNEPIRFEGREVSIDDVLGTRFDRDEIFDA